MNVDGKFLYKGVVEDNQDPLKMGRCRVRILGLHTKKKIKSPTEGIPTGELPWANPAWPITTTAVNDIGEWAIPVQGSWVLLMPEDNGLQRWIYFATLSGRPIEGPGGEGFHDPAGKYPQIVNEPDFNRLASNQKIEDTIIPIKITEVIEGIPMAGGGSYFEPQEPYDTTYGASKVIETERNGFLDGHIVELDDTPGSERIHIWHKVGTWISIHANGQFLRKTLDNDFEFIIKNQFSFVNENRFVTVVGDNRELILENKYEEIYGAMTQVIAKDALVDISGDFNLYVGAPDPDEPAPPNIIILDKSKTLVEQNVLKEEIVYYEDAEEEIRDVNPLPETHHALEEVIPDSLEGEKGDGNWRRTVAVDQDTLVVAEENTIIGGDSTIMIEGDAYKICKKDYVLHVGDNAVIQIGGALSIKVEKNKNDEIDGDYRIYVDGNYTMNSKGTVHLYSEGGGVFVTAGGNDTRGGCITDLSVCPFILQPHLMGSIGVKVSY